MQVKYLRQGGIAIYQLLMGEKRYNIQKYIWNKIKQKYQLQSLSR